MHAKKTLRIDDLGDDRIDDYRNLKDARLALDRSRVIVEGRGNLLVLLERSRFSPESILLSDRACTSLLPELEALNPDCPIYVAPSDLLDQIVGFPIHRGCLAVSRRPEPADANALAASVIFERANARVLVLEGIINHDNVGGLFRNAMAFGASAVFLCPRTSDPLYRKAIRTSMGGTLCVPFARAESTISILETLRTLGYSTCALDPAESGDRLSDVDWGVQGAVALMLGTEGDGLSEEALSRADLRVRIEMESDVDSINVFVAAGIALHALQATVAAETD